MRNIKIEELNLENVGAIADLSNLTLSDEEDDDTDSYRRDLEEELNKIKGFIKGHPFHQLMKTKNSGKMSLIGLRIIAD